MTDAPPPPPEQAPESPPPAAAAPRGPFDWFKAHTPLYWLLELGLVVLLAVGVLFVAMRLAPLNPDVRGLIEARLQGLPIGPYGKLGIQGLEGDIWRDFRVRRLTIADANGGWAQADDIRVRWSYAELFVGRLHVEDIQIARLHLIRRPAAKPQSQPAGKGPSFSYLVDRIRSRIVLDPAFAFQRGVYDLDAGFAMIDRGPTRARIDAQSVLRRGDFFKVDLKADERRGVDLSADAREVAGGSIAGIMGLPANQPFDLTARIAGAAKAGTLDVVVHSGQAVPLRAAGAWSRGGGGLVAQVTTGTSRWTAPLAERFGPQAQVTAVLKPRRDALYDADVRLIASNVVIMARGPVDAAKRSSGGLAASIVVKDLHKLTPTPQMGPGKATGILSGDLADLRFVGALEANELELWGWRLAKATAPAVKVSWRKGEFDVQGTVIGSGGSGSGLLADAGGPTPKATVDVARLKDGRVLIRSLDAVGRALRLQGAGGQNPLFRGLSFKGQMQIVDLSLVRPGAKGTVQASWSATQDSGAGQPWVFTAEGRGERLVSGAEELDRLMGPEPRLTLAAAFQDGAFTVAKAELAGAKARAAAAGRWALGGDLDLKLDWQAEGPFGLGPLEIDGKAHGTGVLAGALAAPKAELAADFDSIAFPRMTVRQAKLELTFMQGKDGSDGVIALTGGSDYGPARAKSEFRFAPGGFDLAAIDADAGGIKAAGALSVRDGKPFSADLTMAVGPGVLLSEGLAAGTLRIAAPKSGGVDADIDLSAKGIVIRGQPLAFASARLQAKGPLARLPYKVSADGAWLRTPIKLDGAGAASQEPNGYAATFNGSGMLRRAPFKTLEPAVLRLSGDERSARLRLALGGGQADVDVRQGGESLDLAADLSQVDLSFLSEDFTGRFDAKALLSGRGPTLTGDIGAEVKGAHSRDAAKGLSIDGDFKAKIEPGRVIIDAMLNNPQGLAADAHLVVPAAASASPFRLDLVRDRPLQGAFEATGQVQPLWDLFLGGERTLGGQLNAKAQIAGTAADPRFTGRLDLANGLFDDYSTGLKLRNVALGAALNGDTLALDHFQATDGAKGQATGSGRVSLVRGGGGALTLNLNGFRLIDNDTAQADATGQVTIIRDTDGKAKIAGTLQIVRGEANAAARTGPNIVTMDVVEKNRPFRLDEQSALPPSAGPQSDGAVTLDVALKASRGVFIKGRGLDLEMALDARVTGTTAKPVLEGDARVVRGDYDFAGKRFEFDNRGTVRLSTDPSQIRLDLTATRTDAQLTAVIRIQGTATKPQITLTSTPVLPNDEVLSQVLFGSSAAQLSPLEAAQLASALTALAGGGGFDVIGNLRSFARIDRLALSGGGQTGVTAAVGKYLTDNVYLEVGAGARTGATAQLEYRVTRNLSIVSKVNNQIVTQAGQIIQGGDELSIRWRQDFRDKAKPAAKGR